MSEHTKGPWSVHPGHYPGFLVVKGASLDISIMTTAIDLDFKDFRARTADAHLIAAAPDLLEAPESIILNASPKLFSVGQLAQARAAIAKAKGEAK